MHYRFVSRGLGKVPTNSRHDLCARELLWPLGGLGAWGHGGLRAGPLDIPLTLGLRPRGLCTWDRNVLEARASLQLHQETICQGFYSFSSCLGSDLK